MRERLRMLLIFSMFHTDCRRNQRTYYPEIR